MDTLQTMRVFVRVAQRSGFAAAARDLRMSRASVTKHIVALEARLGVRLLDRTTRSVRTTEAGRVYLERCLECLQAFEDADASVGGHAVEPRGVLRVAAPFDFCRHLAPILVRFSQQWPAVTLDVRFSNRTLDMVDEGIDVYLRVTNTVPADAIARPLAVTGFGLWGSRAFFRRHGIPRHPSELAALPFAAFDEPPLIDEWVFERGAERLPVRTRPALITNSGELLTRAVWEGRAVAVLPSFLLPEGAGERLTQALPEWSLGGRHVFAVYPHRRFAPPKVHAFVKSLRATLGDPARDPWWPRGRAGRRR